MSTRRRKPEAPAPEETRAFTVVVEEMRGHFRVFGEQLDSFKVELRAVKDDVHELKADVHGLKADVCELKHDVHELKGDVGLLKIAVLDINRNLGSKVDRPEVEAIVEQAVTRRVGGTR